jgi:hypothetical protein
VLIDVCDARELASNSEATKPYRLGVGNTGADREGALVDIEHARHTFSHLEGPAGDEREAIRADINHMNVDLGLGVGGPYERGLRDVDAVVAPARLHPPDVDDG